MTEPARVLLVDDNILDRELIRRMLGPHYETSEASTGREAIRALTADKLDCALIDYRLPDVDGLNLLSQFLERGVPVVMLTGHGDETIAVEAMKLGAQDYLSKVRLDPHTLRRAVSYAIEKQQLRTRIEQQQEELRARVTEVERQRGDLERSNTELRDREAKLRVLLEQLPAIVWTTDSELRYTSTSGQRWVLLTVNPALLLGLPVDAGFAEPGTQQTMLAAHRRALAGERSQFEVHVGGATCQTYVEALHDASGAIVGVVGVATDVTSTRLLEQQLRVAQKMEALGKLAGGVAHDFNNLLTAILSFTAFARDALPVGSSIRSDLDEVLKASERAAQLVRQLLAFSRHGSAEPRTVHVGDLVNGMLSMLSRTVGQEVDVQFEAAANLWNTRIAPTSLEQVVVNLVVNARDALPQGGHVRLAAANVTVAETMIVGRSGLLASGDYVMLSVSDDGVGIAPELLDRIFDPFFTTKGPGRGTGLGLATCYGIIGQAGGEIVVSSEPGRGTKFNVYLQRSTLPTDAPRTRAESPSTRGSETILVVEDEPQIQVLAVRALREAGYSVLEASSPFAALEICRRHPSTIHLVLSDVVMPEMGGVELVARIRELRPNTAVLYMSGYTNTVLRDRSLTDSGHALLDKPFTPAVLTHRIRDVLAATASVNSADPLRGQAT